MDRTHGGSSSRRTRSSSIPRSPRCRQGEDSQCSCRRRSHPSLRRPRDMPARQRCEGCSKRRDRRTNLEDVKRTSHITSGELEKSLSAVFGQVDPTRVVSVRANVGRERNRTSPLARQSSTASPPLTLVGDRSYEATDQLAPRDEVREDEPKASAAGLDGGDDLVHVVADDAEADVLRELLDDLKARQLTKDGVREPGELTSSESGLSCLSHHIGLIQNDELESSTAADWISSLALPVRSCRAAHLP